MTLISQEISNKVFRSISIHKLLALIVCLAFHGCQGQTTKLETENSLEQKIWEEFVSLPATDEVNLDIDTLLSENVKRQIAETIEQQRYFQISIQLQDSVIVEATARYRPNDMSKEVCEEIGSSLIGHRPTYEFIDNYEYGSYDFVIDKKRYE